MQSIAFGFLTLLALSQATSSPVEKVVVLLKDLQTKAQADGKAEQQVYDKYACWCEKTSKRKAEAIEQAQLDLRSLGQQILKYKALVAVRTAEIAKLEKEITANKKQQAAATTVRSNENAAYQAEAAETKEALAALQMATQLIVTGAGGSALLQDSASLGVARNAVGHVLEAMPGSAGMMAEKLALLAEFAEGGGASKADHKQKYAPQSATIQGILKDMYETFANDLESNTNTEATRNREFENYIAIKAEELAEMEAVKAKKEGELSDAEASLAEATQAYDDTEAQKKADIEFFDTTKEACAAKHEDWVIRDDLRTEELKGIGEALEILTSDDARALFGKSIQAGQGTNQAANSFLQMTMKKAVDVTSAPMLAYAKLKEQATKAHSFRLAELAVNVRMAKAGHFDAVIKAIDEMISTIKDENQADIEKRDQCKDEYKNTDSVIAQTKWLIEKNEARIAKLQDLIDKHTKAKEETIALIGETEEHIQSLKDQRQEENQAFLAAKADDESAIELLESAKEALGAFYEKNTGGVGEIQGSVKLLQKKQPEFEVSKDQAPDADFSGKDSRKGESKGIVSILTMIIEDAHQEIKNGQVAEASAQTEFEKQLKAAETLLADLILKKNNLETEIARLGDEKSAENETMESNKADLKDEVDYRGKITPDCDWIIGAFTKRAQARTAETEGLEAAKVHLVSSFVQTTQKKPAFDDASFAKIKFLGISK
jgi:hypothetical protein